MGSLSQEAIQEVVFLALVHFAAVQVVAFLVDVFHTAMDCLRQAEIRVVVILDRALGSKL